MLLTLDDFKKVVLDNRQSLVGGAWCYTGGTTNGHRDDMDVNGHCFTSNGDGTYKRCIA